MKVTPENIYNLVGGHCPGQDQRWIWVSSEVEAEVLDIISQALAQIEPDLREIWIKRECEAQEFEEVASNRERGPKGMQRLCGGCVPRLSSLANSRT